MSEWISVEDRLPEASGGYLVLFSTGTLDVWLYLGDEINFSDEEKARRVKCRGDTNHAITQGKLNRMPCEPCGGKAEAHHDDYSKPLDVRWLCFKHHREWHRQNPELLENDHE